MKLNLFFLLPSCCGYLEIPFVTALSLWLIIDQLNILLFNVLKSHMYYYITIYTVCITIYILDNCILNWLALILILSILFYGCKWNILRFVSFTSLSKRFMTSRSYNTLVLCLHPNFGPHSFATAKDQRQGKINLRKD